MRRAHSWRRLAEGRDAAQLLADAVREGVAFVPGAPFYAEAPVAHTARLSFVTLDAAQIDEALARLRRALVSPA